MSGIHAPTDTVHETSSSAPTDAEVLQQFRIIVGSVRRHFRMIEESCGISGAQVWMLREIAEQPGIGVTDLALRLSIHQTTCSQLAEKLVARRLIEKRRDAQDQRRVGLSITLAGLHVLEGAPHPIEGVLPAAIGALSAAEKSQLSESLSRLITHLAVSDQESAGRPLAQLVDVSSGHS